MNTKELIERILMSSGMTEKDIEKERERYKKSNKIYEDLMKTLRGE